MQIENDWWLLRFQIPSAYFDGKRFMRFHRETSVFKFLRHTADGAWGAQDFQARRDFELDSVLVVLWPRPYNGHPKDQKNLVL